MKYLGSKNRIAKHILPIMLNVAKEKSITTWVELFVGGGNMIDKVPNTFKRVGVDINPHTIQAMIGVRDYLHNLPVEVSEEEYKAIKGTEPNPITSWVRFVCSFGGKFENGYAREKGSNDKTFVTYGLNNAKKQSPLIQNVDFICDSYENYSYLENCLIYNDIPYFDTTSYKTTKFDHNKYWEWVRMMSKKNEVFTSEYVAPNDFECVWQGEVKTNFASQRNNATHTAIEKLFKLKQN